MTGGLDLKSAKNKTIDIPLSDGGDYLERCLRLDSPVSAEDVENRLILGDSFKVMELLPRGFADLIIADPPYNLTKTYGSSRFGRRSDEEYRRYTESWLDLCVPLLKPTGTLYVCCDWQSGMVIGPALQSRLSLRNRITWQREKGRGAKDNWKSSMEDVWYCTVSKDFYFDLDSVRQRRRVLAPYRENGSPKGWQETESGNFRDTCPSNFWDDVSVPYWSMAENTAHPAQKPEKLLAKLILASSRENDMVFDPFSGSGSTAVTAKKLSRRFCAVEAEAQYNVWAQKRLELADGDKTIQGYAHGVFWERNTYQHQKRGEKN